MRNTIWALALISVGSAGTASAQMLDFALTTISIPLPSSDIACCVAVGDFNGDGKQDLALLAGGAFGASPPNEVVVLLGKGDGTFQTGVVYSAGIAARGVAVGDFNGDGKQDLAVANVSSGDVSVLLGNGDGTFQPAVSVPAQVGTVNVNSGPSSVAVGDFNGDGKQDLVVLFPQSDQIGLLLGNGDGTFKPLLSYPVDRNPRWVGVADFNGDGKLDLVTANTRSGDVSVLLGNGDGTFRPAVNLPAGQRPTRGVVGDFNRDGKLDLAILSTSSATISATINVLLGNGDGAFQASQSYPIGGNPRSIVVADFDGDGKLDLAVDVDASAPNTPSLAVLRGNGDGTFHPPIQFDKWVAPTTVFEMAVGDFNNDRKPDVAVANGTSGNTADLSVLINTRTTALAPAIISHLADGGVPSNGGQWSTTILLVNADTHTASYQLSFHKELDGSPLVLPLMSYGSRSSVTGKIAPGQLAVIQTEGSASALVEGWAELVTADAIGGTGIFTDRGFTGSRQEAAVPLNSTGGTQLFIPFDETFGSAVFATGIALANPGTSQANLTVRFLDDSGNLIPTVTNQITLNPGAHKAFVLTWPQYFPEVNGKRGAVEFKSNVPIYGLGIRFNGTAFTSISALSDVPSGNKIISHLADGGELSNGGQWSTTILLVNADMHTASYQLNFHKELDGSPLVLPLLSYGSRSSVTGTITPGQLAVIQTEGSASALVEGWAELVTADAIGGTGIFTDRGATGSRQEAAVPLNSTGGAQLFIPFDETSGNVVFATGIALANPGTSQANITVRFIDDSGNTIPTATGPITLHPGAHKAFVLTWPQYFPEVNGKRGAVEFKSNVPIYGLGIRFNGTAFTSIDAIVP